VNGDTDASLPPFSPRPPVPNLLFQQNEPHHLQAHFTDFGHAFSSLFLAMSSAAFPTLFYRLNTELGSL